jgi:NADH-quinone oxidoreductase subunit E
MSLLSPELSAETRDQLDQVISRYRTRPGALLTILERVQESQDSRYLPRPTLDYVVRSLGLPYSRVQSVATFYAFFNLEPQGRHTICVCRGTACHTRGSRELLGTLRDALDFPPGDPGEADKVAVTTRDGRVTLRTVACIGQCALAPVVEVDRNIFGHMTEPKLKRVIAELPQEGS